MSSSTPSCSRPPQRPGSWPISGAVSTTPSGRIELFKGSPPWRQLNKELPHGHHLTLSFGLDQSWGSRQVDKGYGTSGGSQGDTAAARDAPRSAIYQPRFPRTAGGGNALPSRTRPAGMACPAWSNGTASGFASKLISLLENVLMREVNACPRLD